MVKKCLPQYFEWNKSAFLEQLGRAVDVTVFEEVRLVWILRKSCLSATSNQN